MWCTVLYSTTQSGKHIYNKCIKQISTEEHEYGTVKSKETKEKKIAENKYFWKLKPSFKIAIKRVHYKHRLHLKFILIELLTIF